MKNLKTSIKSQFKIMIKIGKLKKRIMAISCIVTKLKVAGPNLILGQKTGLTIPSTSK